MYPMEYKPYKHIQEVDKVVKYLKSQLEYSKNKQRDVKHINSIIDLMQCFNDFLENQYKTNEIDKLLCMIFAMYLERQESNNDYKGLSINYILNKIDFHLKYSSESNISDLADSICVYDSICHLRNKSSLNRIRTDKKDDVRLLLNDLFLQIKTQMLWNKK